MAPVGYYDLSVAGIPVHSTAFRPTADEALRRNPFRVFTSLLRLDLIDDIEAAAGGSRDPCSAQYLHAALSASFSSIFEEKGGLDEVQAREFVSEAIETFRWQRRGDGLGRVYHKFRSAHPLIADIVCFKGPHINHLTLRTSRYRRGPARDGRAQHEPEGDCRRSTASQLRHSPYVRRASRRFRSRSLSRRANGSRASGVHAARFGEIEQRGIALTAKGRALYDRLLAAVRASVQSRVTARMPQLMWRSSGASSKPSRTTTPRYAARNSLSSAIRRPPRA